MQQRYRRNRRRWLVMLAIVGCMACGEKEKDAGDEERKPFEPMPHEQAVDEAEKRNEEQRGPLDYYPSERDEHTGFKYNEYCEEGSRVEIESVACEYNKEGFIKPSPCRWKPVEEPGTDKYRVLCVCVPWHEVDCTQYDDD